MTMLSPGVYIEEIDKSHIVPNVANNVAFFAGNFNTGPVGYPYVVTNKKELIKNFGYPSDRNFNEWYQAYKFLDYGNQLIISRAYEAERENWTSTGNTNPNAIRVGTLSSDVVGGNPGKYIVELEEAYDFTYSVGDHITIGTTNTAHLAVIDSIEHIVDVRNVAGIEDNPDATGLGVRIVIDYDNIPSPLPSKGESLYLQTIMHTNGGTQVHRVGTMTPEVPGTSPMVPQNDYAGEPATALSVPEILFNLPGVNNLRSNYQYDVIKNPDHWDHLNVSDGVGLTNPLRTFLQDFKIKFFAKTPDTETIEIAIANEWDFLEDQYNNYENKAMAFREQKGQNIEYTPLLSLFSYPPLASNDEIAIAIKKGDIIETYIVSFNKLSDGATDSPNYIESIINEKSNLVYVLENEQIRELPATSLDVDRFGFDRDPNTGDLTIPTYGRKTKPLVIIGGKSPKVQYGALQNAYNLVEDKEKYEIDVIIGNEFSDFINKDNMNFAIDLAAKRKDCIAYIGARRQDTVGKQPNDATQAVIKYLTQDINTRPPESIKPERTMFAAFFANYARIYDSFNKKFRWINIAGDMAGIRCDVSSKKAAWWVSAGMQRGNIRGIQKLAFSPSEPQRDSLYRNGINPVVNFPGSGNLVWGNKTLHPLASSFDRINVRTLFNTLERSMSKAALSQVFEFNDAYTRNNILSMFNPYLSSIKAGRGIIDFLVVCDTSNNTPDVISRNELLVDIFIKPNYAAEMIKLSFTNVGTRSFAEVMGV